MKSMILGFCVFNCFHVFCIKMIPASKKWNNAVLCLQDFAVSPPWPWLSQNNVWYIHTFSICTHAPPGSNPNMLHMLQSNPKMFPQKVILTRFHKMVPTCCPGHNPSYPDMLAPTHRIIHDKKQLWNHFRVRFTFRIINYWLTGSGRITGEHEIDFN